MRAGMRAGMGMRLRGAGAAAGELKRDDRLPDASAKLSRGRIASGRDGQPLVLTTTPLAEHLRLTALDGKAALGVAAVPLAVAVFLAWLRWKG
jgi:hypothetical protein